MQCYIIQNNELGQAFERDLEHGTELTFERYVVRGRIIRGKETISRLLTPLLKKNLVRRTSR